MNSGIVISINLPGTIGHRSKHTTKQSYTVDVAPIGAKYPDLITRKILHTDPEVLPCSRKMHISPAVIQSWINESSPYWVKPQVWKKLNETQRIEAYIQTYDEGLGVTYE